MAIGYDVPVSRLRNRHKYTINIGRLSKRLLDRGRSIQAPEGTKRPTRFGECIEQNLGVKANPCPWISCTHHLAIDLRDKNIVLRTDFAVDPSDGIPDLDLASMPATCALRVAERGPMSLEQLAKLLGLTRERIRQIEYRAEQTMRTKSPPRQIAILRELYEHEPENE